MNDKITPEQSMLLITKMISTARGNVRHGSFHILFWGWLVLLISISHFLLMKYTSISHPDYLWGLIFPGILVSFFYGMHHGRKERHQSYIDRVFMWIWVTLCITVIIICIMMFESGPIIVPFVLMISGYAMFLSGKVLRFSPMIFGGVSFWVWAIAGYFLNNEYSLIVTALSIITGYLIPGYLLKKKEIEDAQAA